MNFIEACEEAKRLSEKNGVVFFVKNGSTMWDISPNWKHGWMFKAYPGGRSILSVYGKDALDVVSKYPKVAKGVCLGCAYPIPDEKGMVKIACGPGVLCRRHYDFIGKFSFVYPLEEVNFIGDSLIGDSQ